ncbi:hypothetical protein BDV36DRAFT_253849 [Aspergillus pseudocaelatus]|uniref:Amine oxidase domain-containing protein n=1 Tax=Aspergillus pseudocaelatus TaxID=1825620 RepID=A0ABQ6WNE2_9EURO|nr:hypothetical protein BDV36DRAFT_253849 [Aspergillus pseudocaelatus]
MLKSYYHIIFPPSLHHIIFPLASPKFMVRSTSTLRTHLNNDRHQEQADQKTIHQGKHLQGPYRAEYNFTMNSNRSILPPKPTSLKTLLPNSLKMRPHTLIPFLLPLTTATPKLQDFDALGAWFDGINAINTTTAAATNGTHNPTNKNTTIAIIGAGISGLTTALLLESVGIHNWEILEASDRVGGRFRTKLVGNTDEWAEMGPMRLPVRVRYNDGETVEYSDHAMVFQLAELLNNMNGNESQWKIDFIPWIQHHENELLARGTGRLTDGSIPTRGEVYGNETGLGTKDPMTTAEYEKTKSKMEGILSAKEMLKFIQRDVWRAHRTAMDRGLDEWSEQAMMKHVFNASVNVTDAIWTDSDYDVFWDEMHHNSNLGLDGSPGSLGETEWVCIDRGFNRLSDAFLPHVSDRLMLNRKIRKLEAVDGPDGRMQTRLSWYPSVGNRTYESKTYDYTIMAVPFTMTRFMDLPRFSSVLDRAISEAGLRFKSACKVALLFSERFWEKGDKPIFGGYSAPPSNSVGALYYPVYGLNESRPGLIMHYRGGDATSWCRPDVEQHRLYIPAYHQTEHNTIFIGEHTAPTHAWVSSSLHSSVRGVVQLLLELGLVEEAKRVNKEWMGRWIR